MFWLVEILIFVSLKFNVQFDTIVGFAMEYQFLLAILFHWRYQITFFDNYLFDWGIFQKAKA
jgi:hypothetical protein